MCEKLKTENTLHVFAMPTGDEAVGILAKALASCQRDLADRDAEISRLQAAITKGAQSAEWHHRRIADRDTLIADLRSDLEKAGTAHASDHIELVARREECAKLQGLLDQMTRWRDLASSDNDTLGRKLDNMTSNYAHQRDESTRLAEELRLMTADRDGWKETGRTEQQNKIKARNQRDEETKARQRVQIELDKANVELQGLHDGTMAASLHHAEQRLAEKSGECRAMADELRKVRGALEGERGVSSRMAAEIDRLRDHSTMQAETLGGYLTEIESLKGALDKEIARVAELQEHGTDQYQEILSLRHDVAERAQREGRVAAMLSAAPECHCDDLQEQLANLHRSGKALIDSLDGSPMPYGLVAFIQSHTRAGDALEEINSL